MRTFPRNPYKSVPQSEWEAQCLKNDLFRALASIGHGPADDEKIEDAACRVLRTLAGCKTCGAAAGANCASSCATRHPFNMFPA